MLRAALAMVLVLHKGKMSPRVHTKNGNLHCGFPLGGLKGLFADAGPTGAVFLHEAPSKDVGLGAGFLLGVGAAGCLPAALSTQG